MRIPFAQIDAFATEAFAGNPAAVLPLSQWPDDAVLQSIAAENNLSETAFLVPASDEGVDYDLRWFTPTAEVALCGHATLASGHFVLSSGVAQDRVRFRTRRSGMLEVARQDAGYAMSLPAWKPSPRDLPGVVAALKVSGVVDTLWYETGYALVIVDDEESVRRAAPDMAALAREGDIVVILAAEGKATDIVSRVFVPAFGIDEDPVTGSAHAVMVPYFTERLGLDRLTGYQASARGGRLGCSLDGDRVVLTGACVTVIEGTFLLP
ncbi:phenazine biosynthesis protein PhzF family [Sphingomonas gellani]|uniref:Phenazine biosynthesis protein PhzF family n=1 Tax=Sphingomonas gellani TaxID=1166340 RepID=A0A1H8CMC1_9SPHN|nr:PhzF family phenazine biosynthesis protein [Sphingomonas gellani]SEM96411.1 phenazine biosynthesis protein PhzF family [Sphingomonas gellani]